MYFRLSESEMKTILSEVLEVVKNWKHNEAKIGLKRSEMELMDGAFRWESNAT